MESVHVMGVIIVMLEIYLEEWDVQVQASIAILTSARDVRCVLKDIFFE